MGEIFFYCELFVTICKPCIDVSMMQASDYLNGVVYGGSSFWP